MRSAINVQLEEARPVGTRVRSSVRCAVIQWSCRTENYSSMSFSSPHGTLAHGVERMRRAEGEAFEMVKKSHMSRRRLLRIAGGLGASTAGVWVLAACGEAEPQIITKEVPVETTVIKEVPVEKIVRETEVREVPVERIVTQEKVVTQQVEVPVERVVTQMVVTREVVKEVPAMRETVNVRWQEVWADAFQPTVEDKMIPGFEAQFPYINIVNERIEEAQMYEIYLTQIAGGDPPDVIQIQESRVPQFAARGGIIPLDAFIGKAGLNLADIFYAGEWPKGSWLGVQYALPLDNTGAWYLFWWNKDTFAEVGLDPDTPPTTWTELEEMALKTTVREGGEITRHGMFVPEMFDDTIGQRNVSWQLDMVQKLNDGWDNIQGYMDAVGASRTAFYNGLLTMRVEGVWFLGVMRRDAPDINAGVTHMPYDDTNPNAKPRSISDDGWSYGMPKGAQNLEEGWEWLRYLTAGEGNLAFMGNLKRPSSVPKYNEDPLYQSEPLWNDLKAVLPLVEASPITPVNPDIDQILKDEMELMMAGKQSPEETLASMAGQTRELLDEFFASL